MVRVALLHEASINFSRMIVGFLGLGLFDHGNPTFLRKPALIDGFR